MLERRALIVGINHYQAPGNDLAAAVADAEAIAQLLERHQDQEPNYDCRVLLDKMEDGQPITRAKLRKACEELFQDYDSEVLFYFSGHGVLTQVGGYLATHDAEPEDWGVPMQEIVDLSMRSHARDILLILDCCHSGDIANPAILNVRQGTDPLAIIRENMTVIAASRPSQVSLEAGGHGLFTAALIDALGGGAADHMGWVTAPSLYAYLERRFGGWGQRPVYKSHATRLTVVRKCAPLIDRLKLYRLAEFFPTPQSIYQLDPEFEPEDEEGNLQEPVNNEKIRIAQLFKEYRDAGLLMASIQGEQLFWTARRSHTVQLTPRGKEYLWLVQNDKI
ncbi:MAG: caspase family protein [Chloroflexia bacterium]